MSRLLVLFVRAYQFCVSPVLIAIAGPSCRFTPSCSEYAIQALRKHGAIKGAWYGAHRICRCQPFSKGGYDPIP